MKILSVVGARPQFIKLASIVQALNYRADHSIVHTGQHYDENLSSAIFQDLSIPPPVINLEVGSGTHAEQTSAMMVPLQDVFINESPDWVLIYGDTNTTVGAAIVAAKLKIPLAHLEAGLRSGNRSMPEEINRIVADHLSDLNLAPTKSAMNNLTREGLESRSALIGDVTLDILNHSMRKIRNNPPLQSWIKLDEDYIIATLHREELTSSKKQLTAVIHAMSKINLPVYLPAHPRLKKMLLKFDLMKIVGGAIQLIPPLGYLELIDAVSQSKGVITDSGGLQKEAYFLSVPCLTIRPETEWSETLVEGWNQLVWNDYSLVESFPQKRSFKAPDLVAFGDGNAAIRAVNLLLGHNQ